MGKRAPLRAAGEPRGAAFVSYLRVSYSQAGSLRAGLEAQREAIDRHVRAPADRCSQSLRSRVREEKRPPEMAKALAAMPRRRATLIIAKLDRLARNVIFHLGPDGIGRRDPCCDMPMAPTGSWSTFWRRRRKRAGDDLGADQGGARGEEGSRLQARAIRVFGPAIKPALRPRPTSNAARLDAGPRILCRSSNKLAGPGASPTASSPTR
jgi:hypothetical protein